VHFETRHLAGSKRRDRAAFKRAAEKGATPIELVAEVEVYRRDHYTCQFCGGGLILNERPRHPNGPSVDHIEWIAGRGPHTYDNTRAAHLGCNTSQGWAYKQSRNARDRRRRAARERYRKQQRAKDREAVLGFVAIVVVVFLILIVSNWVG